MRYMDTELARQKKLAEETKKIEEKSRKNPITTKIVPADVFYLAEEWVKSNVYEHNNLILLLY